MFVGECRSSALADRQLHEPRPLHPDLDHRPRRRGAARQGRHRPRAHLHRGLPRPRRRLLAEPVAPRGGARLVQGTAPRPAPSADAPTASARAAATPAPPPGWHCVTPPSRARRAPRPPRPARPSARSSRTSRGPRERPPCPGRGDRPGGHPQPRLRQEAVLPPQVARARRAARGHQRRQDLGSRLARRPRSSTGDWSWPRVRMLSPICRRW